MLKRKITKSLIEWKNNKQHKPLVIKGCRQCGKTYIVNEFAHSNYKYVIYMNFFQNPEYKEIFEGSLEVEKLIMYITSIIGKAAVFVPGETVLIIDEIQECPQARTSLKFWNMDGRYDVIATGSLLGVKGYKTPTSVPVGYEQTIQMYPLDFEEFLWGVGISEDIIDYLHKSYVNCTPVDIPIHNRMKELLLQYTVIGGMPAVVQSFVENHDMNQVILMQRDIVDEYREDMIKYAAPTDKSLIRECFDSIPKQLAKENKKFQYSLIKKGSTASRYAGSIQWIEDAGIIVKCHNLNITELPLEGNAIEGIFKVYMADTGLFVSMLEDGTQYDILRGNLYAYKGAVFENLVADIFSKNGRKLYYYHKDSGLEIDFIIRCEGQAMLVEVKATTGNTKSSRTILNHPEKYHINKCIKMGEYNLSDQDGIMTIPTYMAFLIPLI